MLSRWLDSYRQHVYMPQQHHCNGATFHRLILVSLRRSCHSLPSKHVPLLYPFQVSHSPLRINNGSSLPSQILVINTPYTVYFLAYSTKQANCGCPPYLAHSKGAHIKIQRSRGGNSRGFSGLIQ